MIIIEHKTLELFEQISSHSFHVVFQNVVANDALASKRAIHEAGEKSNASVDVICSETGKYILTYYRFLISNSEYCNVLIC